MPEKIHGKTESANACPLVTIGIPTYNRADVFLRNALVSALGQTYDNLEIIVSDNCSSDNTEQLVGSFNDTRIRYHRHPENIGANNNFNFCVNQARGDWFLLLPDDDLIDDDFIETCLTTIGNSNHVGIARTGTRIIDATEQSQAVRENNAVGLSPLQQVYAWFEGKTSFYLCSTLFNTRLLQEIGGFESPHNLFQDVVAEMRLLARYGSVDVAEVKASFRVHGGEMTHTARVANWCGDSTYLLQVLCEEFADNAADIEAVGKRFFCRMNYKRATSIDSLPLRFKVYWQVYCHFDKAFSLWRFLRLRYGSRFGLS